MRAHHILQLKHMYISQVAFWLLQWKGIHTSAAVNDNYLLQQNLGYFLGNKRTQTRQNTQTCMDVTDEKTFQQIYVKANSDKGIVTQSSLCRQFLK